MEQVKTIISSFGDEGFCLRLEGRRIILDNVPRWVYDGKILIRLVTPDGSPLLTKQCRSSGTALSAGIPNGTFLLRLSGLCKDGYYYPFHAGEGLPVNISEGIPSFILPKTFDGNRRLFISMTGEFNRKYDGATVPCSAGFSDEITSLASSLVKRCYTQYEKVLAIHDWVAGHIYYDYDALSDGSYLDECYDPFSVLCDRKAVCQGYSSLSAALLRSVGVRTLVMDCFALGYGTRGGWENPDNMNDEANHAINMAYADDRWVVFDATWDSSLNFRNGRFQPCSGAAYSHQMFDPTLAFLSFTHRLIEPEGRI